MVSAVSQVSKCLHQILTPVKTTLMSKVVTIMSELHGKKANYGVSRGGPDCLAECVYAGWYLKVLRVFFFHKPEALFNNPENLPKGSITLLHAAINSRWYIPVPFVSFILEMDRRNKLGLVKYKNKNNLSALEQGKEKFKDNNTNLQVGAMPYWKATEQLLLQAEAEAD